ncbi:MAG: nucleoside triphosphate hydrolase [Polaromonas sp.]
MTHILLQPVQRLLDLLNANPSLRILIALAGLPGSGKSTVAAQWAEAVNARLGPGTMVALGMDGFHLSKATLADFPDPAAALARRGSPWTFDPQALALRLQALRGTPDLAGLVYPSVSWPGFEHGLGDPVPDAVQVSPETRLVLVEGLYLLHGGDGWDLADAFDERWFLDVSLEVAMERLVLRHMAASSQDRAAAEARIAINDRLNAEIVKPSRNVADWLTCV